VELVLAHLVFSQQNVAIDCDRDPEGFGFWLAKAAGPGYVAQSGYKNGEVHHKLGGHLVLKMWIVY
jgi:hypothetical protein